MPWSSLVTVVVLSVGVTVRRTKFLLLWIKVKDAKKQLKKVLLKGGTIPHRVEGRFGASRVVMLPANPGTGVIAGGAVRAVVQAVGVTDILTKCYGSTNKLNLVKATINGLTKLRTKEDIARLRGVEL